MRTESTTRTADGSRAAARGARARRKLRALKLAKRRAKVVEPVSTISPALANALAVAHAAYALCARKTQDESVAVAASNAAASLASSFTIGSPRLGDRLRLEWLAALPNAESSLFEECARVLGDAIAVSEPPVADRVRLASAEAFSLASAVASEAGWRSPERAVAFLSFAR